MPKKKSTRSAQGSGTIRKRKDGTWEGRYTVGRDPGTGKQIQKSVYANTQKLALKKLQAAVKEINDGTYSEPEKVTVKQWFETWQEEYLGNVKRSTAITYEQHIKNHIIPSLGSVKLVALKPVHIQRMYNQKHKDGMSPKTIKNVHGVVHKALHQARLNGLISSNPSDNCILPRVEKKKIEPLDTPEISKFLEALKGNRLEHLFKVDLFTGLRCGEIIGLTWDCVDFEKGIIEVSRQITRPKRKGEVYRWETPKNDKLRTITPAPYVMDVLQARRKEQIKDKLKAGAMWDEGEFKNLVFTNEYGRHLAHDTVYDIFQRTLNQAGLPRRRFHDLRHTYAVSSLLAGDDIKTVQENLGHHTAAFTLDQYGHVTETMRKASASRMEAFISGLEDTTL